MQLFAAASNKRLAACLVATSTSSRPPLDDRATLPCVHTTVCALAALSHDCVLVGMDFRFIL